jgi:hypothetical protein
MATKKQTVETTVTAKTTAAIVAKKITASTIYGKLQASDIPDGQELPVCRMAGYANEIVEGSTQYGVWEGLKGDFAGTNKATGEITLAKVCIVPGAMGEALISSLKNLQKDDAAAEINFSVDVSIKVSVRDPAKYEFVVRPVIEGTKIENRAVAMLALEG